MWAVTDIEGAWIWKIALLLIVAADASRWRWFSSRFFTPIIENNFAGIIYFPL